MKKNVTVWPSENDSNPEAPEYDAGLLTAQRARKCQPKHLPPARQINFYQHMENSFHETFVQQQPAVAEWEADQYTLPEILGSIWKNTPNSWVRGPSNQTVQELGWQTIPWPGFRLTLKVSHR
jgi:hypothetical protein